MFWHAFRTCVFLDTHLILYGSVYESWFPILLYLQALSAADFLKILEATLIVSAPCLGHAASIKAAVLDILAAARAPTALLAEATQGCTDAITAVSEAAHACWVRLLNAR